MSSLLVQPLTHRLEALKIKQTARALLVSIAEQSLVAVGKDGAAMRRYEISTSAKPPSCVENSFGTPTGLHRIARKIGEGAELGAVFKARIDTGRTYEQLDAAEQEPNLVTTRILWLEGLEPGHNAGPGRDSFQRYIYIHGTNHEELIGTPCSGGCVLLRNEEMVELYGLVCEGDLVFIS